MNLSAINVREDGFVIGNASVTEICAPIGFMRRDLATWLNVATCAAGGEVDAGAKR